MSLRDLILQQFEPAIATALIEFGKHLSTIDADVVVFMARKSLCLYDVLQKIGVPPVEKVVVSDRILNMDFTALKGKKIALIDDTLILGTTLAKAKEQVRNATGVVPSVHVFCADSEWWSRDLILPEYIGLELNDAEVMTFCTGVVRALGLLPRPYLVDFPLSTPLRLHPGDLQCAMSSTEWITCDVSSAFQRQHDVFSMTLFPTSTLLDEWASSVGNEVLSCTDLVKARMFGRRVQDVYWVQFVPLVTLKPMATEQVDKLLDSCLTRLLRGSEEQKTLRGALNTPIARQRAIQYSLSCALGHRLFKSVADAIETPVALSFDINEASRHYGPWLEKTFSTIHDNCALLWDQPLTKSESGFIGTEVAVIPSRVQQSADELLHGLRRDTTELPEGAEFQRQTDRNVVTTLTEVFLQLFSAKEMPARKLVKQLGAKALRPSLDEEQHLERLDTGIPWRNLFEHLQQVLRVPLSDSTQNIFSLALDQANDLGVLVPITCESQGVVFRAYRHGEDVRFADSELALAFDAIKGLLDHSGRPSVPRLTLEKLLVLLIKCGAANGFLEPYYGTSGADGIARIAFHLQGAIPVITRGPRDHADRDLWLTRYLLDRQVISQNTDGTYGPKRRPDGHYLRANAPGQAYELGALVGMVTSAAAGRRPTLGHSDLILLATCGTPRHTAAALEVELRIFSRWYAETLQPALDRAVWQQPDSLRELRKVLLRQSGGHEAVHGIRLKFVGYREGAPAQIVKQCESFLRAERELDARRWSAIWAATDHSAVGETEQFDPFIDKMATLGWEMACALGLLELAIDVQLASLDPTTEAGSASKVVDKIRSYTEAMQRAAAPDSALAKRVTSRMTELRDSGFARFDCGAVVKYLREKIQDRLPALDGIAETVSAMTEEYGRLVGRHDYTYMAHYDIIDSTGTEGGRQGKDLEQYRNGVRNFKRLVNEQIHRLGIQARKERAEVYCWNGDKSSTNDEKHIFVSGKFALRYLENVVTELLEGAHAFKLRIRLFVVPCNFAGTAAYRSDDQTEIQGERFWEHYSRIARHAKSREPKAFEGDGFVAIATEKLIAGLKRTRGVEWRDATTFVAESEIELLTRQTTVRCAVAKSH
jgi:hypothetical protein